MHWCLDDVTEIHGPTGIRETAGMDVEAPTTVVYPDSNPRGIVPQAPLPEEGRPIAPELIPPGEQMPDATGASPGMGPQLPNYKRVSPGGPRAGRVPPGHPAHSGPVAPVDYAQPIPPYTSAQQGPVAPAGYVQPPYRDASQPATYHASPTSPARLPLIEANGPTP